MEGEQPTIAADVEQASPAIETPATEQTVTDEPERIPSPEEALSAEQAAEAAQVEDDSVEIEWDDGNKYRIPKALEPGILKNKDYTQKTQAVSAKEKTLEAREAQIEERFQATDEEVNLRLQSKYVDSEIQRFKDYDFAAFQQHQMVDPLGAQEAWAYAQSLHQQKAGIAEQLKTAESKRTETAQQSFAKRVQDTLAEATKIIPGTSPETVGKTIAELADWAHSRGIPEQTLKANWSPVLLELLYHAKIGHGLLTKQATAPKPAQTVVPQPLKTVGGGKPATTSGDLASLDMEAYVAARKKGVGGKPLR
jgi:hypothetical protein